MEEQSSVTENQAKKIISSALDTMLKVITAPKEFYKGMTKTGGFTDPLIFMVLMGVVGGIIRAVLSIIGLNPVGGFFMAIASIILVPIFIAIFGFVTAAILFVIWKIMGSQENYETSYRCIAYASAITPITGVINIIPYVGTVLGLVWVAYLLIQASTEVHNIALKTAQIVFGAICAILALSMISAEYSSRKLVKRAEQIQKEMNFENMTPEEAGKAVGEFLKGMQEAAPKE